MLYIFAVSSLNMNTDHLNPVKCEQYKVLAVSRVDAFRKLIGDITDNTCICSIVLLQVKQADALNELNAVRQDEQK